MCAQCLGAGAGSRDQGFRRGLARASKTNYRELEPKPLYQFVGSQSQ